MELLLGIAVDLNFYSELLWKVVRIVIVNMRLKLQID